MKTKLICAILAITMLSMLLIPFANAWNYGNPAKSDDLKEEYFGPRADRLIMPFYASQISEWETGLEGGIIDVTDWPLDDTHYTRYTTAPWNNTVLVRSYGPEFGLRLFDINQNPNQYLGNPPNPLYPNPRYIAGAGNPGAELSFRKAVAYLTNRAQYIATIGSVTTVAVYTPVGANDVGLSAWGKYTDWDITTAGARSDLTYPYSVADANNTLNAAGVWPYVGGVRTYKGQPFTVKLVARIDDWTRDFAGTQLGLQLQAVGFQVTTLHVVITAARTQVMANKDFTIYTGGWSLSVEPDYLILWNGDFYFHTPGVNPQNYADCNNAAFNTDSYGVMNANTQSDAQFWAIKAQVDFATNVLAVPIWIAQGQKAVSRIYTGGNNGVPAPDGENIYRGLYWQGFVNVAGFGMDSGSSFLNMRPEGFDWGNGDMTIRYGLKTEDLRELNPVYTEFLWDNTVIDLCGYDSLLTRNPLNLASFEPWAAVTYSVGLYKNPALGNCTKVVFTLRNDYFWTDGTPVTIADIYYTYVEMTKDLVARGLARPWWISNVLDILSFSILDPCNFEVLLDTKAVFAIGWVGGNRIMPKHVWAPICKTGDPTVNNPDPNLITSGPWRLLEYTAGNHVVLVANKPGSSVLNNLVAAGTGNPPKKLVTSTMGYFRYLPIDVFTEVVSPAAYAYTQKLPPEGMSVPGDFVTVVTINMTVYNMFADRAIMMYPVVEVNGTPVGPTPSVSIPSAGNYAAAGKVYALDFHGVFDDFDGGFSYWIYNGTHIEYHKYLWVEPLGSMDLTWNGAVIATLLDDVTYWIHVKLEFPIPAMTIPQNVRFHYDLEWYITTNIYDTAGTTWYDAVSKIKDPTNSSNPVRIGGTYSNLATYPFKGELPAPDGHVDGQDITYAAGAFGTKPGDAMWSTVSDVNHDYKVDGQDIALIAMFFGWPYWTED